MNASPADISDFAAIPGGFVSLRSYTTREGGTADYLINGGVNYAAYNERRRAFTVGALAALDSVTIDAVVAGCAECDPALLGKKLAAQYPTARDFAAGMLAAVRDSYLGILGRAEGNEGDWAAPAAAGAVAARDLYEAVAPGVKTNTETGETHVSGLLVSRRVLVAAPEKSRRADTHVRDWIKARAEAGLECPTWVQFRLGSDNWSSLAFAGRRIENTTTAAIAAAK